MSYFFILYIISCFSSGNQTDASFYTADRNSPWFLVAWGMIGTSLSGVTFISVPGEVANSQFTYIQIVMGYLLGYFIIARVLLPLYYKYNLVSIYTYLYQRLGFWSYKTSAFYFMISRIIGASFRLFLVASVLQLILFERYNIPFWVSVCTTLLLILAYTFKGGIKTIVWTDTLQTFFMLLGVILSILMIKNKLDWTFSDVATQIIAHPTSQMFNWDGLANNNFFKHFFSGAFIALVMTGLDQDMMQKNLTCRTIKEAQKNIFWFCIILVFANLLFLSLGSLLYQFAEIKQISLPERTDDVFPFLAMYHFSLFGSIVFLLGITSAAFSSADSALTALTTSFCVDFLGFNTDNYASKKKTRIGVHLSIALIIFIVILIFRIISDESVLNSIFKAAGYTYGPLLGLFTFGIATKWNIRDRWVPVICLLSPLLSYWININSEAWFNGYKFGFEILILNGLLCFLGLILIKKNTK